MLTIQSNSSLGLGGGELWLKYLLLAVIASKGRVALW